MNGTGGMAIKGHRTRGTFWRVPMLAALLSLTAGSAWGQAVEEGNEALELDPIVVTGSRIKRSQLQGPQPMLIIDQQEMAERGYTTVYEALSDLTSNNGYKFETAECPGCFTPDVQTINLRGFGVGTTLTLINGRRLTNYPAAYQSNTTVFSFGSIPVAAIERIEILAVGASAIYGSDAVAGVVNIILRSDIDETTFNALWGTPTEAKSTRNDFRLQFVTGKTFNRGGYTFTGEYLDRDSILGEHYEQFDNQQDDYPFGQGVYDRSIVTADIFRASFGLYPYYRDPADLLGTDGGTACSLSGGGRSLSCGGRSIGGGRDRDASRLRAQIRSGDFRPGGSASCGRRLCTRGRLCRRVQAATRWVRGGLERVGCECHFSLCHSLSLPLSLPLSLSLSFSLPLFLSLTHSHTTHTHTHTHTPCERPSPQNQCVGSARGSTDLHRTAWRDLAGETGLGRRAASTRGNKAHCGLHL